MSYQCVALSGSSYCGTTTLSSLISGELGWKCVSAGHQFRDLCRQRSVKPMEASIELHREFDSHIRGLVDHERPLVIEGRYLGLFAAGCPDVLSVRLTAPFESRVTRCSRRQQCSHDEAVDIIRRRDASELRVFNELYREGHFLKDEYFDLDLTNDEASEPATNVSLVIGRLR